MKKNSTQKSYFIYASFLLVILFINNILDFAQESLKGIEKNYAKTIIDKSLAPKIKIKQKKSTEIKNSEKLSTSNSFTSKKHIKHRVKKISTHKLRNRNLSLKSLKSKVKPISMEALSIEPLPYKHGVDKEDRYKAKETETQNVFFAEEKQGFIGTDDKRLFDSPVDNVFTIKINHDINNYSGALLSYKIKGIAGINAVSKSINARLATGGYIGTFSNDWTYQSETIDIDWLHKGINRIIFSKPEDLNTSYSIKDITITLLKNFDEDIVAMASYKDLNEVYIKGFVKQDLLKGNTKLYCNNKELQMLDGSFEAYVPFVKNMQITLKKGNKVIATKPIKVEEEKNDFSLKIEQPKNFAKQYFTIDTQKQLSIDGAKITIDKGALNKNKIITVYSLRNVDLPPLPPGMVNVTKNNAYRFLPDGTTFEKPVTISIGYDETKIPNGFKATDIKTFYFDVNAKKWQVIPTDSVQMDKKMIVSKTTHFTDYINGIIKVPESPQTSAFTPTAMSDIKAADPLSGINLIAPPSASQKGDVNLSYPIKIPAGRNGMQPNLALQYSSSGGNSSMGEGWSIPLSSISLDTRWGMPTFDNDVESEIYSLDGSQLMYPKMQRADMHGNNAWYDYMPNRHLLIDNNYVTDQPQHRDELSSTLNNINIKKFGLRKQNPQLKIERIGDAPNNYRWKVISSDGQISWYGGNENSVLEDYVLRVDNNPQGNITHWDLYKTEDVYGNNITYEYDKFIINNNLCQGDNQNLQNGLIHRIKDIIYTGFRNEERGAYSIKFDYDDHIVRKDIRILFNQGLKEIFPFRLRDIEVLYKSSLIRKYHLNYDNVEFFYKYQHREDSYLSNEGRFGKTILGSISELDAHDHVLNTQTFQYYDDLATKGHVAKLFDAPTKINYPNFEPSFLLGAGNLLNPSPIKTSEDWGVGGTLRLGIGLEFGIPTGMPNRNIVFGSSASYNEIHGIDEMTMLDIDGDGLDDFVYYTDNGIKYLKHEIDSQGNHSFSSELSINNLNYFSKKDNVSVNPIGANWDIAAFALGASGLVSWTTNRMDSKTPIYLTDGNSDGLMDVVKEGSSDTRVYFNYLDNNLTPTFTSDSKLTPNLVVTGSNAELTTDSIDYEEPMANILDSLKYDVVRLWVAPKSGDIVINDDVTFYTDNPDAEIIYTIETKEQFDPPIPVRLYLGVFNQSNISENINITNYYNANVPLGSTHHHTLHVNKDQLIFFRYKLNSEDEIKKFRSNPYIHYVDNSYNETYEATLKLSKYSEALPDVPADVGSENRNIHVYFAIPQVPYDLHYTLELIDYDISNNTHTSTILNTPHTFTANQSYNNTIDFNNLTFYSNHKYYLSSRISTVPDGVNNPDNYWHTLHWYGLEINPSIEYTNSLTNNIVSKKLVSFYDIKTYDDWNYEKQKKYRLFGSMYKGWGQFLYNSSLDNSDDYTNNYSDQWGKLINYDYIFNLSDNLNNNFGSGNFNGISDGQGLLNLIGLTNANSVTNVDQNFSNLNIQQGDLFQAFFPMTAVIEENDDIGYKMKWMGLSSSQFSARQYVNPGSYSMFVDDLLSGPLSNFTQYDNSIIENGSMETGMFAIPLINEIKSKTKTTGAGAFSIDYTNANSHSIYNKTHTGFVDLNGDGYPDICVDNKVQYTTMTGGLKDTQNLPNPFSSNLFYSGKVKNHSHNLALGGGLDLTPKSCSKDVMHKTFTGSASGSVGITFSDTNLDHSHNYSNKYYADINGDGLIDQVFVNNGYNDIIKVKYNNGSNFNQSQTRTANMKTPVSQPGSIGLNAGFSVGVGSSNITYDDSPIFSGATSGSFASFSISPGISASINNNRIENIDINGDGMPDMVKRNGNRLIFMTNYGNRFDSSTNFVNITMPNLILGNNLPLSNDLTESFAISGNLGYYYSVALWLIPPIYLKLGGTLGINADLNISEQNIAYKDFDGDGYLDVLFYDKKNDGLFYHKSRIKRTNKLRSVTNSLGGSFIVDYEAVTPTYDDPHAHWVMKSLVIKDGVTGDGEDKIRKEFEYHKAHYDRREREFYGFKDIIEKDIDKNGDVYRTSVSTYNNTNYFMHGNLDSQAVYKGNPSTTNIYSQTSNSYEIHATDQNGNLVMTHTEPRNFDEGGTEGRRQAAALLVKTTKKINDFGNSNISSLETMQYDNMGRVINYTFKDNERGDSYSSSIKYHGNTILTNKNIVNIPAKIEVRVGSDLKRERYTEVNDFGEVTDLYIKLNNNQTTHTQMTYDNRYGNLETLTLPSDMYYKYTYDNEQHKYIERIDDAFGYYSISKYDPRFDVVEYSEDISRNGIKYEYDSFGRLVKVTGPKELAHHQPYTIKFTYYPTYESLPRNLQNCFSNSSKFVPVAISQHYDLFHRDNNLETYSFTDGWGKSIQVKKDIEVDGREYMSVSGLGIKDEFGRIVKQYNPTKELKDDCTNIKFNPVNSPYYVQTEFDEMDRPVKIQDQEGNQTLISYDINRDAFEKLSLHKHVKIEQNSRQSLISDDYTDIRGAKTTVKSFDGSNDIVTKFKYDAIGQLVFYKDNDNITTYYKYDLAGHVEQKNNPDFGTISYIYDQTGNLVKLINGNGDEIEYKYTYGRLEEIKYPRINNSPNISDVRYYYYDSNENDSGRLKEQTDASGSTYYEYGNMGEITHIARTVVVPNMPSYTFNFYYKYDSWNRLINMVYPDLEELTYHYDLGGNLTGIDGQVNGNRYAYITNIKYDEYEQQTEVDYGNGTKTTYTYSPSLHRLNNMMVKGNDVYLNNNYEFDFVGNITSIKNGAGVYRGNAMLGNYNHGYSYDRLNRLQNAGGSFTGDGHVGEHNDYKSSYELSMAYSGTGDILFKKQYHQKNNRMFKPNTYANEYSYISHTHKLKHIKDQNTGNTTYFDYDRAGNTITIKKTEGKYKNMYWDESNRLRVVKISNNDTRVVRMQHYIYDAAGERILKANTHDQEVYENGELVSHDVRIGSYTIYPNGNLVMDNDVYTKHYYMGTNRFATQVGSNSTDIFISRTRTPEMKKLQKKQIKDLQYYMKKAGIKASLAKYEPSPIDTLKKNAKRPTAQVYFYHPDHLGTATLLTDLAGAPYQLFLNLPFGEEMAAQHSRAGDYSTRYKFNGKELDQETGWYYYGARYYDPQVSRWLSVDPLAEKYPAFSPYNFTMNNPVRLVDPTGMGPGDPPKKKEKVNKTAGTAVGENVTNELDSVELTYKVKTKKTDTYNGPYFRQWDGKIRHKGIGKLQDYGPISNISYTFMNDIYLTSQVLFKPFYYNILPENPLTGQKAFINLDGTEHYEPPVGEFATTIIPMLKNVRFVKILNVAEFSTKFKGTFLVRKSAYRRGLFNRLYNMTVKRIHSGAYFKTVRSNSLKLKEEEND